MKASSKGHGHTEMNNPGGDHKGDNVGRDKNVAHNGTQNIFYGDPGKKTDSPPESL
jgi:hypothetical protein